MSQTVNCPKQDSNAQRVLDTLQRWSERFDGHQNQKRQHERRPIRMQLSVYFSESDLPKSSTDNQYALEVWARNISRSGMCFIHNGPIKLGNVIIAFNLGAGETEYFRAQLVRNRQVHDGFWEYGVKFLEKVEN